MVGRTKLISIPSDEFGSINRKFLIAPLDFSNYRKGRYESNKNNMNRLSRIKE